jgi:hypothetical protein
METKGRTATSGREMHICPHHPPLIIQAAFSCDVHRYISSAFSCFMMFEWMWSEQ